MKNPFLLLTIGVCSILLIPALFMDGMFMDGMLYAAVSKNYAMGIGTFWEPFFSATSHSSFHEQPPLMFFLQGMFFKILGNGLYTERIYSLLAALVNSVLIIRCWKIVHPSSNMGWMPVLFWFTMPVTFYAFINNLEECTMSVFVLAAMIHLLRALHLKQKETLHLLLAGLWILLAGLTKGLQGMFLLGTPFIWMLCIRTTSFPTMIRQSFLLAIIPVAFVVYAWFTPVVHASFQAYFFDRFVSTFGHVHDTSGSRFHILYELLLDTLILMVTLAVVIVATKNKTKFSTGWNQHKKLILFFAITAATGILPLMITMEQRGFYLVTALPFIAIAAGLLVTPQMEIVQENLRNRLQLSTFLRVFGVILIIGSIISSFVLAGKPKRDKEIIHDLALIATQTGTKKTILTSNNILREWGNIVYAMRIYDLSLTEDSSISDKWLFIEKTDSVPSGYQLIPLPTQRFNLFRKQQ